MEMEIDRERKREKVRARDGKREKKAICQKVNSVFLNLVYIF